MNPKLWKWLKFMIRPRHVLSLESPIYAGLAAIFFVGGTTIYYMNSSDFDDAIEEGFYIPIRTEYNSFRSGMRHLKENILGFKKTTD